MCENVNSTTSEGDRETSEKFSHPEWIKLFNNYPDYKEVFDRNTKLSDLFAPKSEWAKLLAGHKEWLDLFNINIEVARLFANDLPGWAELFFPNKKWIGLFDDQSEKLIDHLKNEWGGSLKENLKWLQLFVRNPDWVELFISKPQWFKLLDEERKKDPDLKWLEQLAEDKVWNKQWTELFDNNPEWAFVFASELKQVNKRRKLDEESNNCNDLVGLAFSGGGIRSASFGLGVLEALRDFDVLKKIDYLSTVSGGGYIGAWLSANCQRAADEGIDWLTPGKKEEDKKQLKMYWDDSIRYLRRYSNYLTPKVGFFSADTWTMAAVWLRNTLLIQLTVILGIAFLLLLPRWPLSLGFTDFSKPDFIGLSKPEDYFTKLGNGIIRNVITSIVCIIGVAGIAWNNWQLLNTSLKPFKEHKNNWWYWPLGAIFCFLIGVTIVLVLCDTNPFVLNTEAIHTENLLVSFLLAFFLVSAGFGLVKGGKTIIDISRPERKFDYSQWQVLCGIVVPMMFAGFFIASILWDLGNSVTELKYGDSFGYFLGNMWNYWPFPLMVSVVSLFFLSFSCIDRNGKDKSYLSIIALASAITAALTLYALISCIMLLVHGWIVLNATATGKWLAFVWTPPLVLFAFSLSILMLLGILGRDSTESVREWWSRMGAWLGICGITWMVIVVAAVYGPMWSAMLYYDGPWKEMGSGWVGTTLAGLLAGKSANTSGTDGNGITTKLKELIAKLAPFVFIIGLLIAISMVLNLFIASISDDAFEITRTSLLGYYPWQSVLKSSHWSLLSKADSLKVFLIFLGCLACVIVLAWRVDINEFSFNAFYRSRLARCFLGATRRDKRNPQNFTNFDNGDDMPLSYLLLSERDKVNKEDKYKSSKLYGPLHIVNCALNLGGTSDLTLHTRHSAIFTLTPLFCGSSYKIKSEELPDGGVEIGYTETKKYGGEFGEPSLGQAVAVSGAAASPNMGYHTSPITSFLMTLFNVRLGWWFPNPHIPDIKWPSPKFGLRYLIMELFGVANERSNFLSISDGGHFENLAAYELVKRKCKVIIISDGECDPNYQFEGLGTLIRMCEVDFGAKIKIDVRSIHPEKELSWSLSRCAVGEIIYDDKTEGILLYIKASMNSHEDTDVLQYKAAHPDFPHETTGDQFYSEDQFESYRSLGRDITERTFAPVLRKIDPVTRLYTEDLYIRDLKEPDLIECAKKLQDIWSPVLPTIGQFSRHADRLMKLWSEIREDENLKSLDNQLTSEAYKSADEKFRSEFYFCSELIQQMENVYLDMNLEETWEHPDNKGWRMLFTRWAKSDVFKEVWRATDTNYGLRFRYFCERYLKLPISEHSDKE